MRTVAPQGGSRSRGKLIEPTPGLPEVTYRTPLSLTVLITLLMLVIVGGFTVLTGAGAVAQLGRIAESTDSGSLALTGLMCGLASIVGAIGTGFLVVALVKLARDLRTPMYYARGTVIDKRTIGGRNVGNWLAVRTRYAGPDLTTASALTQAQRDASPDRSQVLQPRFNTPAVKPQKRPSGGTYLPAERIRSLQDSLGVKPTDEPKKEAEQGPDTIAPRVVFRVDPGSFSQLEPDEEVLIAYSRHLQHIYFVAHLRGGDWQSYKNKQII